MKTPRSRFLLPWLLGAVGLGPGACSAGGACPTCAAPEDGASAAPDLARLPDLGGTDGSDPARSDLLTASGEDCVTARPLPFVANRAELTDTTLGRHDDTSSRCGGSGPDTVYSLKVVEPYLGVTVTPVGAWSPHVYLKKSCESSELGGDICATSAFWSSRFPTGSYFLVIDSDDGSAGGDYKLEVEERPVVLGSGETCSTPQLLTFSGDTASVTAYTHGSASGPRLGCGGTNGRDVYTFVLGSPQKLEATITALTAGFRPVVSLRGGGTACPTSGDLQCAAATGSSATLTTPAALDTGTYALVVSGAGSTTGQYTLTVQVRP